MPVLALTAGEPAGIGPDLCLMLAAQPQPMPLVVLASRALLEQRAAQLGLNVRLIDVHRDNLPAQPAACGQLYVLDFALAAAVVAGSLNAANAPYVLQTLTCAAQGCLDGRFAAMITAPVHKGIINEAGMAFSGHTEFLAASAAARKS